MKRSKRTTFSVYRRPGPTSNISDGCTQTELSKEGLIEIISHFIISQNQLHNTIGQKSGKTTIANYESSVKLTFNEWLKHFIEDESENFSNRFTEQVTESHSQVSSPDNEIHIKIEVDSNYVNSNSEPTPVLEQDGNKMTNGFCINKNNSDSPHVTRSCSKAINLNEKNDITSPYINVSKVSSGLPEHDVKMDTSLSALLYHKCGICGKVFKMHSELKKHRKEEHNGFVSKCDLCESMFSTRTKMEIHRRLHTGQKPYKCDQCLRSYNELSNLRKHVIKTKHKCNTAIFERRKACNIKTTARKLPCETCGKVLRDVKTLRSHIELHSGISCKQCGKLFKNEKGLQHHIKLKHSGYVVRRCRKSKIPNICPICQHLTKHYVRHVLTHLAEVPTMCKFCAKILDTEEELKTHLDSHTADEIEVCDTCGKAFGSRGRLNEHKRIHTRAALDQRPVFSCDLCNMGFLLEQQLEEHSECHTNNTDFKCLQCSSVFSKTDELKAHILTHQGEKSPVNCPICDIICPTKNWYSRHKVKKHLKNHMCSICGKQFSNNLDLTRHTMLHTGNFKHKCQICSKGFIRLEKLNLHMCIHTGEKPFSCKHCGCTFYVESLLKRHLLQHDSNAEFICSKCKLSFQSQEKLDRHKREHQKNHPIMCSYCDMAFVDTRYRRNHMRSVHGVKDFVCDICTEEFNCRVDLINHRSAVHGPEYVYTCNICSKRFVKKVDLTVHIRKTHTRGIQLQTIRTCDNLNNEKTIKTEPCTISVKTDITMSTEENTAVTNTKQCSVCGTNQVHCDSVDDSSVCDKCKEVEKSNIINASENILLEIPSEIATQGPTPGVLTCLACSKTFVLFDSFLTHMHEHPELQIKIETIE